MYQARFINPLIQFGKIEFDLVITDDEGLLPELRVTKSFNENVTALELEQIANEAISKFLISQELPEQPEVESGIDLPNGVELSNG